MSDSQQTDVNPYANRDHENSQLNGTDLKAVAALVGTAASELRSIDEKNVGDSSFTKALKFDPVTAVKTAVKTSNIPVQTNPKPVATQSVPVAPPLGKQLTEWQGSGYQNSSDELEDLRKRVSVLEKLVESDKAVVKFKRGISYDLNTTTIKGNFKNPGDVIDIVLNEMAKNTKTITLKLCDANKNR